MLGLVFPYQAKRLAWWLKRSLRNDLLCVVWDVKPQLNQWVDAVTCRRSLIAMSSTVYGDTTGSAAACWPDNAQCVGPPAVNYHQSDATDSVCSPATTNSDDFAPDDTVRHITVYNKCNYNNYNKLYCVIRFFLNCNQYFDNSKP